jgi:hypothetical protein
MQGRWKKAEKHINQLKARNTHKGRLLRRRDVVQVIKKVSTCGKKMQSPPHTSRTYTLIRGWILF